MHYVHSLNGLTFSEQYFNYIQDQNKVNNIYKLYGMGQPGQRLLTATEKVWRVR